MIEIQIENETFTFSDKPRAISFLWDVLLARKELRGIEECVKQWCTDGGVFTYSSYEEFVNAKMPDPRKGMVIYVLVDDTIYQSRGLNTAKQSQEFARLLQSQDMDVDIHKVIFSAWKTLDTLPESKKLRIPVWDFGRSTIIEAISKM